MEGAAFTLVELLVVIAIIGILVVALLLPAIQAAAQPQGARSAQQYQAAGLGGDQLYLRQKGFPGGLQGLACFILAMPRTKGRDV